MISVSDILKILEQWPRWKALTAMPERLKALEDRVAALEARPKAPAADACPLCGEAMKVTASDAHPIFGTFGVQERTLTCTNGACGHSEKREFDPSKQV